MAEVRINQLRYRTDEAGGAYCFSGELIDAAHQQLFIQYEVDHEVHEVDDYHWYENETGEVFFKCFIAHAPYDVIKRLSISVFIADDCLYKKTWYTHQLRRLKMRHLKISGQVKKADISATRQLSISGNLHDAYGELPDLSLVLLADRKAVPIVVTRDSKARSFALSADVGQLHDDAYLQLFVQTTDNREDLLIFDATVAQLQRHRMTPPLHVQVKRIKVVSLATDSEEITVSGVLSTHDSDSLKVSGTVNDEPLRIDFLLEERMPQGDTTDKKRRLHHYPFSLVFQAAPSDTVQMAFSTALEQCDIDMSPAHLKRHEFVRQTISRAKSTASQINRTNMKKTVAYVKQHGAKGLLRNIWRGLANNDFGVDYHQWALSQLPTPQACEAQRNHRFAYQPKVSIIVPTYRTPEHYLHDMIRSVQAQTYPNWDLCIADGSCDDGQTAALIAKYCETDPRIKCVVLDDNLGISGNTNAALSLASGEYIALFDHDDVLPAHALYEIVAALQDTAYDVIYTDEDKINSEGTKFLGPHFKPDFSWELLRSCNYITHFFIVKKDIVDAVGGFRSDYDGSQDYDFILRCVEQAESVCHVPKILYHWRIHNNSVAGNPASKLYAYEAAVRAIASHYDRQGITAEVTQQGFISYRSQFTLSDMPLLSVVVVNNVPLKQLKRTVQHLLTYNTYHLIELLVVDNGAATAETQDYFVQLQAADARVRVITVAGEQRVSALKNAAVAQAQGTYYLFVDATLTLKTADALHDMLGYAQLPGVGVVGAKILSLTNRVRHAGIVLGLQGLAGHVFLGKSDETAAYMSRNNMALNYSAVSGDCLLVSRELYQAVGGLDESLNDYFAALDFCLKTTEAGHRVVYDAYAKWYDNLSKKEWYHRLVTSVSGDETSERIFHERWAQAMAQGDPYYNPNWSRKVAFKLNG